MIYLLNSGPGAMIDKILSKISPEYYSYITSENHFRVKKNLANEQKAKTNPDFNPPAPAKPLIEKPEPPAPLRRRPGLELKVDVPPIVAAIAASKAAGGKKKKKKKKK